MFSLPRLSRASFWISYFLTNSSSSTLMPIPLHLLHRCWRNQKFLQIFEEMCIFCCILIIWIFIKSIFEITLWLNLPTFQSTHYFDIWSLMIMRVSMGAFWFGWCRNDSRVISHPYYINLKYNYWIKPIRHDYFYWKLMLWMFYNGKMSSTINKTRTHLLDF